MIVSPINELTVWLDSLEDINTDVSLIRILCCYNYLATLLGYPHQYVSMFEYGYESLNPDSGYGDAGGYNLDFDESIRTGDGYGECVEPYFPFFGNGFCHFEK